MRLKIEIGNLPWQHRHGFVQWVKGADNHIFQHPFLGGGIPQYIFGTGVYSHFIMLDVVHEKSAATFVHSIVADDAGIGKRINLKINTRVGIRRKLFVGVVPIHITGFEVATNFVGTRYQCLVGTPKDECQECTPHNVWAQPPVVRNATGKDGDNLCAASHFGSEEDDRDKYKQGEK